MIEHPEMVKRNLADTEDHKLQRQDSAVTMKQKIQD